MPGFETLFPVRPFTNFDWHIVRFLQLEQSLGTLLRRGILFGGRRGSGAGEFSES
jgi:hypothetical protein